MTKSTEKEIAALISQSDDIAKQVKLENWDVVEMMTMKRQQALEQFFIKPIKAQHANSIEKMIRSILASDRQLVHFIETEKKKSFNNYANLKNNSRANQTYKNIASLNHS